MDQVIAAVRVRDCTITRADILFTPKRGGVLRVQTNRTGSTWAFINRETYNGIIEATGLNNGEQIRRWLLEKVVTIRAKQRILTTNQDGQYTMWTASVHQITGTIPLIEDYRLGSRNRG